MRYLFTVLPVLLLTMVACAPPDEPIATSADGVPIEYEVFGDSGPPLVLVHGWSNNRRFWDPHIRTLSETFRVVTLDLGGHGESGANRSAWTMNNFGQDVVAVANTLDLEGAFLVGFSMGGAAVLEAATAIPERVAGVVFVDIFQNPDQQYSEEFIEGWIIDVGSRWNDPEAMSVFIAPDPPDSLKERVISLLPPAPPDYWWEAVYSFFHWSNTDLTRLLQGLDVPVAAINAETPSTNVEAFREYAPSFSVKTISEVGHIGVIWMKVELFDQLLNETISEMMTVQGDA